MRRPALWGVDTPLVSIGTTLELVSRGVRLEVLDVEGRFGGGDGAIVFD